MSFFITADDIDDGDLFIFEGGVKNINVVDNNVVVIVSAVDIDDRLEASIFAISRFGDMFEFNGEFMVFCNLPSLFVGGEVLLGTNAVCGMVMCSALTTTMTTATTMATTTAWAGGGLWSQKEPGELFLGGRGCQQLPIPF